MVSVANQGNGHADFVDSEGVCDNTVVPTFVAPTLVVSMVQSQGDVV